MACRARTDTRTVLALVLSVTLGSELSAHRHDEYLQAARIAIDPGAVQVELDLTPGIEVADAILGEIDGDRDGLLSSSEQGAYVARVLSGLDLQLDGQPLRGRLLETSFPAVDAVRRGEGVIRVRIEAALPRLAAGSHQLFFRNAHRRDISVYLANALVPASDRIAVTAQRRDVDQHDLTVEYTLQPAPMRVTTLAMLIVVAFTVLAAARVRWRRRTGARDARATHVL